jgi:recombination protein RecA
VKQSEKEKAVEVAVEAIHKQFGAASIISLGDDSAIEKVEVIPTGSVGLDVATGVGGYPRGRIVELSGPESGGKTTMALHAVAEAQKLGGIAAYVDAEHSLDVRYAAAIGVNVDKLWLSQPDYGEQALEIVEALARSAGVDVIVVDSVAALTPKSEIEGEMGDATMGVQARLMSQAMRKLTAVLHRTGTLLIFINQLRMKIGVMFGNPETTTGGNALKFYASMRLDVRRLGSATKEGEVVVASHTRVKVIKNKVAAPFREAEFDIRYGVGIDSVGEILDAAVAASIIEKSGSWFSYGGERIGQGREAAATRLRGSPKELAEVKEQVRLLLGQRPAPTPGQDAASAKAEE